MSCHAEYDKYFTGSNPNYPIAWSEPNCSGKKYILNKNEIEYGNGIETRHHNLEEIHENDDYDSLIIPPNYSFVNLHGYNDWRRDDYLSTYGDGHGGNIHPDLNNNTGSSNTPNYVHRNQTSSYATVRHVNVTMDDIKEQCCNGTLSGDICSGYNTESGNKCDYYLQKTCSKNVSSMLTDNTINFSKQDFACRSWCKRNPEECTTYKQLECGKDIRNILTTPKSYKVDKNTDYSGNHMFKQVTNDESACAKLCTDTPGCKVGIYDTDNGECWLQSGLDNKKSARGYDAIYPGAVDIQTNSRCNKWCMDNPKDCDMIKSKFCSENPDDPLCRCINFENDPEWLSYKDTLIPSVQNYSKDCLVKACSQRTDLYDTLITSDIIKRKEQVGCPPIITVDQSITVNGDNNILSNISQNSSIDISMPPVQRYNPDEEEYLPPQIPLPVKEDTQFVPPTVPDDLPVSSDPLPPDFGETTDATITSSNPYIVYGIDLKSPNTYILLFILILVVVAVLVGVNKYIKKRKATLAQTVNL